LRLKSPVLHRPSLTSALGIEASVLTGETELRNFDIPFPGGGE